MSIASQYNAMRHGVVYPIRFAIADFIILVKPQYFNPEIERQSNQKVFNNGTA
jgi:hypothetical protein